MEEDKAIARCSIRRYREQNWSPVDDRLVVEAPLEVRVRHRSRGQWQTEVLTVTMRTPGHDVELALGFLFAEGLLGSVSEVESVQLSDSNVLIVNLIETAVIETAAADRNYFASASCGICGKTSLENIHRVSCHFPQKGEPKISPTILRQLPDRLRAAQRWFEETGGIHAAGLFSTAGDLLAVFEDIGRHNAVDKVLGHRLQNRQLPLRREILVLSGRIGFELVQKAAMSGLPIVAAVGAPSSLAVDLAMDHDMTLVGFLKKHQFNVYCGTERIQ